MCGWRWAAAGDNALNSTRVFAGADGFGFEELTAPGIVPENIRRYLQAEIQRRLRKGNEPHTE